MLPSTHSWAQQHSLHLEASIAFHMASQPYFQSHCAICFLESRGKLDGVAADC